MAGRMKGSGLAVARGGGPGVRFAFSAVLLEVVELFEAAGDGAGEVGLVADDAVEGGLVGQEAGAALALDVGLHEGEALLKLANTTLFVGQSGLHDAFRGVPVADGPLRVTD